MSAAWEGNWKSRIYQRVRSRGFDSVSQYASRHAGETLFALADDLGEDVAAIQVEWLLREEASVKGTTAEFARDLLIRYLRERTPDGWGVAERYDFEFEWAAAFARWTTGLDKSAESAADRVWEAFKKIDIPKGWLPEKSDDPILGQAFAGIEFPNASSVDG
jgi:hypothetical protein